MKTDAEVCRRRRIDEIRVRRLPFPSSARADAVPQLICDPAHCIVRPTPN
jgi:hypothetical protein